MTLALWIDPSDGSKVTLGGSPQRITAITDKSSAANNVAETVSPQSGPQPTIVLDDFISPARQAMIFEAGDELLKLNASPILTNMDGPDFTVVVALRREQDAEPTGGIIGMSADVSPEDDSGWRIRAVSLSPTSLFAFDCSVGDEAVNSIVLQTTSNFAIISLTLDQTRDLFIASLNGVQSGIAFTGTLGFANDLRIGSTLEHGAFLNGVVCEALYFDGVLPQDEITRIEGYLAHKWNLVSQLPTGHPFKSYGPDIVTTAGLVANFDYNGVTSSPEYTAETGQVGTLNNGAILDMTESVFGGASLRLGTSPEGDMSFPDSSDWEFGSGDFTVECWVKFDHDPTGGEEFDFVSHWTVAGNIREWILGQTANQLLFKWSFNGTNENNVLVAWDADANVWYHLAVARKDGHLYMYVDGVLLHDVALSSTIYTGSTSTLNIGGNDAARGMQGWIDGVRVVAGKALYAYDNFVPPARAPRLPVLSSFIGNFNNGVDDPSPRVYTSEDASARTATFAGTATLDTAQKKFGVSSLLIPAGSPASYINFPDSSPLGDYNPGAGNFTIEFWVRFNGDPGTSQQWIIANYDASTSDRGWSVELDNNQLGFAYSTTGGDLFYLYETWNPEGDTWYHVCIQRDNDTITHYVDGVALGHVAFTSTINQSAHGLDIGNMKQAGGYNSAEGLDGWIDGVRITIGDVLYSKVEVPDQIDFHPVHPDPTLLIKFDGTDGDTTYTTDDSTGYVLTFTNAQLDDVQRRFGNTSAYFSASNHRIATPDIGDLTLGTNDFTIEMWIYANSLPGGSNIFFDQRTGSGSISPTIYCSTTTLYYYAAGGARINGGTLSAGQWYHVAVCRHNSVTRMYLDGVKVGVDYSDGNNYVQHEIVFGNDSYSYVSYWDGWIDGVRIYNGTAIYHADFDVPTAPPGEPII
jgi:hypothetical protein